MRKQYIKRYWYKHQYYIEDRLYHIMVNGFETKKKALEAYYRALIQKKKSLDTY